ncbi:MAG: peptidase E [Nanoarchaeota archaeon]|nr:peptidase E [Nanoarchaeota archaeon]
MKSMRKIVVIGGGDIQKKETLSIDRETMRLSGKKCPKLLFIPTASSDALGYWENIQEYFGRFLKCTTDVLFLLRDQPGILEIRKKILSSDIVYVGGGNTLKMMRLWRRLGVDRVLEEAWRKGIVMSGVSAGSICWFQFGHSDSMSFYNPKKWKYIKVRGLGFARGIHCPHYDSVTRGASRRKRFQEMIRKGGGLGIAIDNNSAIEFLDDTYRVISSKHGAGAYRVYRKGGKVVSERIKEKKILTPIAKLYE